jgi:hypothetical protein
MVLQNFVFGKSSWSVSMITNFRINAQFVNNTLIIVNLTNKVDVVTRRNESLNIYYMEKCPENLKRAKRPGVNK